MQCNLNTKRTYAYSVSHGHEKKGVLLFILSVVGLGLSKWKRGRPQLARCNAAPKGDNDRVVAAKQTTGATERYLLYFMLPFWVATGLADYIWHRCTSIETTSGPTESALHVLMMAEAGLPILLGLFVDINTGVILLSLIAFFAHEATAVWDVAYAVERRKVLPGEQHVHSFLEVLPFCVVSFVICLHWDQFAALVGFGSESPQFGLKRKLPALPRQYILGLLGGVAINASVYGEELLRCLIAKSQGLTGVDTESIKKWALKPPAVAHYRPGWGPRVMITDKWRSYGAAKKVVLPRLRPDH